MRSAPPPASLRPHLSETVLITGGAGFIGSHVADRLLACGKRVRVLDSLIGQVHGDAVRPDYLAADVELQRGDVRDPEALGRALDGADAVVHLAARVGVGQSMYEIGEYTSANSYATAALMEALAERPVRKLVVASSMSIYGEGAYENGEPVPTPETKLPELTSVYALTKYDQERTCLLVGDAYRIPTVALRLFNVYGPRQALSNPYTGVLAIFAARLLNDRPPRIFEDGRQRRDFVSVHDVARAFQTALDRDGADGRAVNIGSGSSVSVLELAHGLARLLGKEVEPEVTGEVRVGDIRHCFADVSLARDTLGFEARVTLEEGMAELAEWLAGQTAVDNVDEATLELARRGLTREA
jgi:dTDP-L-rhamnose 4-epimerase